MAFLQPPAPLIDMPPPAAPVGQIPTPSEIGSVQAYITSLSAIDFPNKAEFVGQWTSYLHTIVRPPGGGGGGEMAAILAAIANLNGRFDVLIEEVRSTNRSTAILANNNSLVRYDLFEFVKLSLCISVLARNLMSLLFFFLIIIKASGRGPLIPIRNAHNIFPANANPPVQFPALVSDLNSMNGARLTSLLQFYNQPVGNGNVAAKRQKVTDFLRQL